MVATITRARRDTPVGGDLFCGGGGAAQGLSAAGIEIRVAANHDSVAIATHAANHPGAEHYEVDLLAYDVAKLPAVEFLHASPSCVFFSKARANKAMVEPTEVAARAVVGEEELEAEGGHGWRSRVLMTCPLRYAAVHRPAMLVVENVVDAVFWGPNRDGSTFRWWLAEWGKLGYETEPLFLNSAAFGVPQLRDRMYVAIWRKGMRRPDLSHRVEGFCARCDRFVDAVQRFRPPRPSWPVARWGVMGKQWDYVCGCGEVVEIALPPAALALELSDTGVRLGDRARPLAESTLGRIRYMLERHHGTLPGVALNRAQQKVYGELLSELGSASGCVVPMRRHTRPGGFSAPCHTITAQQRPAVAFGHGAEQGSGACGTETSARSLYEQGSLFAPVAHAKNNGGAEANPYHSSWSRPFGTMVAGGVAGLDPTSVVRSVGGEVALEDVRFRMLRVEEVRRIMAYGEEFVFAGPDGRVLGQGEKVRLLGNGVTPPVLSWINERMLAVL
jgi:DNA (cytosine-5)-methyltransferase 1